MARSLSKPRAFDPDATEIDSCDQIAILLNLCHDFLADASQATRDELRQFLTTEGLPPEPAVQWLTDMLCLMAVNASTCHGHTHHSTP